MIIVIKMKQESLWTQKMFLMVGVGFKTVLGKSVTLVDLDNFLFTNGKS